MLVTALLLTDKIFLLKYTLDLNLVVAELSHDAFLETQGNDPVFAIVMNPPILLT